jgi:hypothetical protein
MQRGTGPHRDRRHGVRHRVVQFAGDAQPFLRDRPPGVQRDRTGAARGVSEARRRNTRRQKPRVRYPGKMLGVNFEVCSDRVNRRGRLRV